MQRAGQPAAHGRRQVKRAKPKQKSVKKAPRGLTAVRPARRATRALSVRAERQLPRARPRRDRHPLHAASQPTVARPAAATAPGSRARRSAARRRILQQRQQHASQHEADGAAAPLQRRRCLRHRAPTCSSTMPQRQAQPGLRAEQLPGRLPGDAPARPRSRTAAAPPGSRSRRQAAPPQGSARSSASTRLSSAMRARSDVVDGDDLVALEPPGACTSAVSPSSLPISARAIGELDTLIRPCFRSASSSPTIW